VKWYSFIYLFFWVGVVVWFVAKATVLRIFFACVGGLYNCMCKKDKNDPGDMMDENNDGKR